MSRFGALAKIPRTYLRTAWWGLLAPRLSESEPLVVAQAVVLRGDGKTEEVLLSVRADVRGWELPGGNLEPGETAEQMQDTKDFIASLPFDSYQESGTAEIEGTPLATLRREGHLAAYEGATIDDTYEVEADGAKKFRELAEKLKAS